MAIRYAPHARMVRMRNKSTGEVVEAWPVDARDYVASGHFEYVTEGAPAPVEAAPAPPAPPPPVVPPAEALADLGYKDLQRLATRAGVKAVGVARADIEAALAPLLAAGTLSLEQPLPLAKPDPAFARADEAR